MIDIFSCHVWQNLGPKWGSEIYAILKILSTWDIEEAEYMHYFDLVWWP